jgi:hypothetical protein
MDEPKTPQHPNAATDPDCTNPTALKAALDIRIAAELHVETVAHLHQLLAGDRLAHYPVKTLLEDIEKMKARIELRYAKLRELIGLTGGD